MCDPFTLALIAAGTAAATTVVGVDQANTAQKMANDQARAAYTAAQAQLEADYQAANAEIAREQEDTADERSDRIRQANKVLGTMMATENSLSNASVGTFMFEELYGQSLNYARLDKNLARAVEAGENQKWAAQVNYINNTSASKNAAENAIQRAQNNKVNAVLSGVNSGLQIGAGYQANQAQAAAQQKQNDAMIAAVKGS